MSAFVRVRRQTIGKANLAIIISAWSQIEKVREGERDRGNEERRPWVFQSLFTPTPNKEREMTAAMVE